MTSIYGSSKVFPFDKQDCDLQTEGLGLEPVLEAILLDTMNGDWYELVYIWKGWRDVSGGKMREQFKLCIGSQGERWVRLDKFIFLGNLARRLIGDKITHD